MKTKQCSKCGEVKPISEFWARQSQCKPCHQQANNESNYRTGKRRPLGTNKNCTSFLGVHVAERVLSKVFNNVEVMPYGNPGYDFICGKGYKIDVKSSVLHHRNNWAGWQFAIANNAIADYFLCLVFDNRDDLNPEYIWLIPGDVINNHASTSISVSTLAKWENYLSSDKINKIKSCCNTLKDLTNTITCLE